ncbi:hypothetical protein EFA69_14985 [Rufibacter immobilis]|uniref:MarR family transcriptional regulator n=1 Tax=Rufibacter immobilis TaxID=1348778 RepID=A0A3M9MQF6_9BACT|nr:hypothetical protein [Rufibacter immobilis]RNI27437.1 hypothetical protein EFA69_14985 [Rufibacter immobilis]
MTDQEFDILDELYFVVSYAELQSKLGLPEPELREALRGLISMNYIKCLYPDQDTEVPFDPEHFEREGHAYYFLASKEGLLSHNSR